MKEYEGVISPIITKLSQGADGMPGGMPGAGFSGGGMPGGMPDFSGGAGENAETVEEVD